jgi:hypothetical protein
MPAAVPAAVVTFSALAVNKLKYLDETVIPKQHKKSKAKKKHFIGPRKKHKQITKTALVINTQIAIQESFFPAKTIFLF